MFVVQQASIKNYVCICTGGKTARKAARCRSHSLWTRVDPTSLALSCLPCPSLVCGTTLNTTTATHTYVQVCHIALLLLYRHLWLASWWWVCILPRLLGSLLHASSQASSSPSPIGLAQRDATVTRTAATCVVQRVRRVRA